MNKTWQEELKKITHGLPLKIVDYNGDWANVQPLVESFISNLIEETKQKALEAVGEERRAGLVYNGELILDKKFADGFNEAIKQAREGIKKL